MLNALAAIAVATELGVPDAVIQRALAGFQGIGRRFQMTARSRPPAGRVLLVDDYGHHPREIAPTTGRGARGLAGAPAGGGVPAAPLYAHP